MSLLCINCQGLGKPQAVKDLCELIGVHKPSLVFLSETKLTTAEMHIVINKVEGAYGGGSGVLWTSGRTCYAMEGRYPDMFVVFGG